MAGPTKSERVTRKRRYPTAESTDKATRYVKQVKTGAKAKSPIDQSTQPDKAKAFDPKGSTPEEWKDEERHWIKCHYQLLLSALDKAPCSAPEVTISCAYFNAYFQGYVSEPTKDEISQLLYAKRTFAEFREEIYRNHRRLFEQVTEKSLENTAAGVKKAFHPIVTPSILETYIKIQGEFTDADADQSNLPHDKGTSELVEFIKNVVTQQIASSEPTWIADGRANILRRRPLNMSDRADHKTGDYKNTRKNRDRNEDREEWYNDYSARNTSDDYIEISYRPLEKSLQVRMEYRNIYADVGNALLNMAILRPDGYDGDLKALVQDKTDVELPLMNADQRKEFDEHVEAVKAGDALRRRLFEEDEDAAESIRKMKWR
ncbi:uncharacterized protein EKO05_0006098 [Ascochyta rabiei]|uniref:uncharacterized protein n=1 Tax=Didymella rabiei TaxID=5454 RepID=UPI0021FF656B|nr:uncharacterized protein EKO05_0006098 [Ascochyta rabiei]UPX15657.1 hypothetical protein EKO05_0006098 [Ascochyta rabiei]